MEIAIRAQVHIKFFRVYDENWVAGEAHIDRMLNANFNLNGLKHVKIGRPNLLDILKKANQVGKIDLKERLICSIYLLGKVFVLNRLIHL